MGELEGGLKKSFFPKTEKEKNTNKSVCVPPAAISTEAHKEDTSKTTCESV